MTGSHSRSTRRLSSPRTRDAGRRDAWLGPAYAALYLAYLFLHQESEALHWLTLVALPFGLGLLLGLAGFTEEFFFRGALQLRLERLTGSRWAAPLLAALVFGIYHVPYAYYNPAWPSAGDWGAAWSLAIWEGTLDGLLLGGLFLYTRHNLLPWILVHALIDAFPAVGLIRFGGS